MCYNKQCLGALHMQRMWHIRKNIVRPCLEYACVMWNPYSAKDSALLEAVQNWAVRWIIGILQLSNLNGLNPLTTMFRTTF